MAHEADFPYLGSRERFITTLGAQYFAKTTRYLNLTTAMNSGTA